MSAKGVEKTMSNIEVDSQEVENVHYEQPSTRQEMATPQGIQGADAHGLQKRQSLFATRPALANSQADEEWCLDRLYLSWRDESTFDGSKSLEERTDAAKAYTQRVLCARPKEFTAWLEIAGIKVWESDWQHMAEEEYIRLIAPIMFASAICDIFPDISGDKGLDWTWTHVSSAASYSTSSASGQNTVVKDEEMQAKDVFMGREGDLPVDWCEGFTPWLERF